MDTNIIQVSSFDQFIKIFPVISLIAGALLTLTITLFIQWYNDRKRRKQTKAYLLYSVRELIKNSKKTLDDLDLLIKSLEGKPEEIPILNIPIGFNVKSIEIVDFGDRFKIFVLKNKRVDKAKRAEYLNKFNNAIEMVKTTLNNAMSEIDTLRKNDDEGKKTYNEYFHKMQDILNFKTKNMHLPITETMLQNNPYIPLEQEKDRKLMNEIYPVYNSFFKDNSSSNNIYAHYKNLILPIFDLAQKYNDLVLAGFFPPMIEHCKAMISTREAFTERFKMYGDNVQTTIQYLEEIVSFLK